MTIEIAKTSLEFRCQIPGVILLLGIKKNKEIGAENRKRPYACV